MMSKTLIAFFAFIGLTGHAAAADGAACRALSDRAHSAMFAQILDAPTNILSATVSPPVRTAMRICPSIAKSRETSRRKSVFWRGCRSRLGTANS